MYSGFSEVSLSLESSHKVFFFSLYEEFEHLDFIFQFAKVTGANHPAAFTSAPLCKYVASTNMHLWVQAANQLAGSAGFSVY